MPVLRIIYEKKGTSRFISANYIGKIFERCLRRNAIPFGFSQGFTRRIKMSFGPPLAVGIAGNNEIIDVHVKNEDLTGEMIKKNLNIMLPDGLKIIQCRYLKNGEKSPPEVKTAHYIVKINNRDFSPSFFDTWKIIHSEHGYIKIAVSLEKFKHSQIINIFGVCNIIERFLIF